LRAVNDKLLCFNQVSLWAFVYDPDGYINNPKGFERDLSDSANEMYIKIIVAPH